jgi:hypothetical protein
MRNPGAEGIYPNYYFQAIILLPLESLQYAPSLKTYWSNTIIPWPVQHMFVE